MRSSGLMLSSACALLLTGATLNYLGWFTVRAGQRSAPAEKSHETLSSEAARWRHGQANHWRSCLLQQ